MNHALLNAKLFKYTSTTEYNSISAKGEIKMSYRNQKDISEEVGLEG